MEQKLISLTDNVQVVEREPEELSNIVVAELISLIQRAQEPEEARIQSEPAYWFYRMPFPGVRYYSYQ